MTSHPFEQMLSIVSVISNGVLDRFPKLKVGFLEAGVGFLPYWMERFDEKYLKRKSEMEPLKMLPSEYVKNNRCYFTCEGEESALPLVIDQFGDQCMMYASDYPHWDTERPDTVSQVVRRKTSRTRLNKRFSRTTRKPSIVFPNHALHAIAAILKAWLCVILSEREGSRFFGLRIMSVHIGFEETF
jgi:uncharacterized protein